MESSDNRRQSETLPSMNYCDFERSAREAAQFRQRHPSIAHTSISTASPISPTTLLGPPPPPLQFSSSSVVSTNGYISPPDSRRTSGNEEGGRQSLPSLQEALFDKLEKPYTAPSPMQTPPLGQGSFSGASASHPPPMPRSQPSEPLPSVQSLPPAPGSQIYAPPPPPPPAPAPAPASHGSGPPAPIHHHEPYDRRPSQEHTRALPPNPYSQTQPPPPTIPSIRPPESYPPPPPGSGYQSHSYPPPPPPHHNSPPQYPPTPSYHNGSHSNQYPFPPHAPSAPPPSQPSYPPQPQPHTPQPSAQSPYSYPPRDPNNYQNHENIPPPQTSPGSKGGLKRSSGYGSAIERALSLSTIRRDLDSTKEHSSRIYHIVQQYQDMLHAGQSPPGGFEASIRYFNDALNSSERVAEALHSCRQVLQELSAKEYAEQNAQKMNPSHISEYGGDDNHVYADDTRSNGSQQPDTKKIRRGRAAPPGRCHSCQRAETPEWRRGPDGARTLCNACGLHYAKLTRKLSKNSIGSAGAGPLASARKAANSPLP